MEGKDKRKKEERLGEGAVKGTDKRKKERAEKEQGREKARGRRRKE